jgi:HAD superfamily hydrolase (TIGR01509 family)
MVKAILFDLFETLITECRTRPPGVSSLAPALGCERAAFRSRWKILRPAVAIGRVSFRQALYDIATALGGQAPDVTLQYLCNQRIRAKAEPFTQIERPIIAMLDDLRQRDLRLGVISNCFAEDVTSWPDCPLAPRFDTALFSWQAGMAKPDPEIYREATRRLGVSADETWFIGDGADDELPGAERAGLRAFRALWFLRRWPHFQQQPGSAGVARVEDIVRLVDRATGPPGDRSRVATGM